MRPKRSHWAWGTEDRFPDEDARRLLAQHVAMLLGTSEPTLRPLPSIEDASVPEPRVAPPANLLHIAQWNREERIRHTYGRSYRDLVRGFRGDFTPAPDWVATPETEEDIASLLAWCSQQGVAAIPFGGGTSVVSGIEADVGPRFSGAVSIDMGLSLIHI